MHESFLAVEMSTGQALDGEQDRTGLRRGLWMSHGRRHHSLGGSSDGSDLDEHAGDKVRSHSGSHRLYARELLLVDRVEGGKLRQVGEVHQTRHNVVERRARCLEEYFDVAKRLRRLLGDIVADHLAGPWIKTALAGQEDPLSN